MNRTENIKQKWAFLALDSGLYSDITSDLGAISNEVYKVNGIIFYVLDRGIASSNDKSRLIRLSGDVDDSIVKSFKSKIEEGYLDSQEIFEINNRAVYDLIERGIAPLCVDGKLSNGQVVYTLADGGTATLDHVSRVTLSRGVDKAISDRIRNAIRRSNDSTNKSAGVLE